MIYISHLEFLLELVRYRHTSLSVDKLEELIFNNQAKTYEATH